VFWLYAVSLFYSSGIVEVSIDWTSGHSVVGTNLLQFAGGGDVYMVGS
jgi:hypothetical protein